MARGSVFRRSGGCADEDEHLREFEDQEAAWTAITNVSPLPRSRSQIYTGVDASHRMIDIARQRRSETLHNDLLRFEHISANGLVTLTEHRQAHRSRDALDLDLDLDTVTTLTVDA